MTEAWIDFVIVGFVAFLLFIVCVFYEKRSSDVPRLLLIGIPAGIILGLLSDFVLWGAYTYPLGYGLLYLTINAAVIYGLFVTTVLLLQRVRLIRFLVWTIVMVVVYETTNYFFLVWTYEVTPFLGWLSFILLGYLVTAVFIAVVAHFCFGYKFRFISELTSK